VPFYLACAPAGLYLHCSSGVMTMLIAIIALRKPPCAGGGATPCERELSSSPGAGRGVAGSSPAAADADTRGVTGLSGLNASDGTPPPSEKMAEARGTRGASTRFAAVAGETSRGLSASAAALVRAVRMGGRLGAALTVVLMRRAGARTGAALQGEKERKERVSWGAREERYQPAHPLERCGGALDG